MTQHYDSEQRFADRHDAGIELAGHLHKYAHRDDVVVLALPRGGVPVGYEVAWALRAPPSGSRPCATARAGSA